MTTLKEIFRPYKQPILSYYHIHEMDLYSGVKKWLQQKHFDYSDYGHLHPNHIIEIFTKELLEELK